MGARASRRRHEGRRIRKTKRQWGSLTAAAEKFTETMSALSDVVVKAATQFSELATRYEVVDLGIPGTIAVRDTREGTVTLGVDPASPYPTQSEVEDGRGAHSVAERVDAMAAKMGLELLPWQRELAIAALETNQSGYITIQQRSQQAGKTTVQRVVAELRGPEHGVAWVDETIDLPR